MCQLPPDSHLASRSHRPAGDLGADPDDLGPRLLQHFLALDPLVRRPAVLEDEQVRHVAEPGRPRRTTLVSPESIESSFFSTTGAANFSRSMYFSFDLHVDEGVASGAWRRTACAGPETAVEVPARTRAVRVPRTAARTPARLVNVPFTRMHGARIHQCSTTECKPCTPRCDEAHRRSSRDPGQGATRGRRRRFRCCASMAAQSVSRSSLRRSARVRTVSGHEVGRVGAAAVRHRASGTAHRSRRGSGRSARSGPPRGAVRRS